MYRPMKIS